MNILIVEDEPRLADALGEIMREQHYLADVVYTGTDGLDYAQNGSYDVILLDNAIKYAGTGGTVTLRLAAAGSQAVLTVHNTGMPIPPDRLPHIFERFYRADPSRTGSGTGLGLAIAQSICQAHHAAIRAESGQDGTTFRVEIRKEQGEHHGN